MRQGHCSTTAVRRQAPDLLAALEAARAVRYARKRGRRYAGKLLGSRDLFDDLQERTLRYMREEEVA